MDFTPNTFDFGEGFREPEDVIAAFGLPHRCPKHNQEGRAIRLWTPERIDSWTTIRDATITYECGCRCDGAINRDTREIFKVTTIWDDEHQ